MTNNCAKYNSIIFIDRHNDGWDVKRYPQTKKFKRLQNLEDYKLA
jgi:hypothetical protein